MHGTARSSSAPARLFLWFMERPRKKQIIVSFGTVLAAKRPQQEARKQDHLEQPAPMRTANVQSSAGRAASQQIKSLARHGRNRPGIVTRRPSEVNHIGSAPPGISRRRMEFFQFPPDVPDFATTETNMKIAVSANFACMRQWKAMSDPRRSKHTNKMRISPCAR